MFDIDLDEPVTISMIRGAQHAQQRGGLPWL